MIRPLGLLCLLLPAIGHVTRAAEREALIVAHRGGSVADVPAVLTVKIDDPSDLEPGVYRLRTNKGAESFDGALAELSREGGNLTVRTVFPLLKDGDNVFRFDPIKAVPKPSVEIADAGSNLEISVAGTPFTTYRADPATKPYLFPILGPDGSRLTRAFPMEKVAGEDTDHPHQRSFWFTYGAVNGVDFWTEGKGHGIIRETGRAIDGTGRVARSLHTTDDWLAPDGAKVLSDERILTFWGTRSRRVVDVDVTLRATEGDVTFGDTKEGMFGLRVPSSMDVTKKKGGTLVNAEGLRDAAAWGKRSGWVDYTGPIDGGKTLSIAILEHPSSYGHPSPWHARDYGLFAIDPFGRHDFGLSKGPEPRKLAKGGSFRFRYRVIFTLSEAPEGTVADLYRIYAKGFDATVARVP